MMPDRYEFTDEWSVECDNNSKIFWKWKWNVYTFPFPCVTDHQDVRFKHILDQEIYTKKMIKNVFCSVAHTDNGDIL